MGVLHILLGIPAVPVGFHTVEFDYCRAGRGHRCSTLYVRHRDLRRGIIPNRPPARESGRGWREGGTAESITFGERLSVLLIERGTLTVADGAAVTGTNRNTIKNKFAELVGKGLAEFHGKGRGAHYWPSIR